MTLHWSSEAANELAAIAANIRRDDPSAAKRTVKAIFARASALQIFPSRGTMGRVAGTRELPLPLLPFLIVHRVLPEAVEIINIVHVARQSH